MATPAHLPREERGFTAREKFGRTPLAALPRKPAPESDESAPREAPPRWPAAVMALAGTLTVALGLLVIVGWHTGHILSSTALWFQSVPVRYNAGICFACGGLALLFLARDKIALARFPAAPLAILGLLTGCEYVLNLDFGIDELFFRGTRLAPSLPPRMAPNTAFCFAVLGAVLLLGRQKPKALHNSLQAFAAGLAAVVGLVGLIGYAADIPTAYGWGRFTPMAAPTAAMMVALGAGAIAFAWRQHAAISPALPSWSPLLAGVTLAAASLALWQALHVLHPQSGLDILALAVGLFQAALLYLVLHLLRGTRERARQLRQLNSMLQLQMDSLARAEGELREKQAYTRSLIEASLDPLVTIAPDGKITDVNAATEAVTGCSRQELIGTDFCDYFTQPEKARAGYQQVFREGGVRDYELEVRHRKGNVTPVLYNASVYCDQAGAVVGVFAAARDISEAKRSEQALRLSEERYRALVLASAQIVWGTPPEGVVEDMPMWREYTGQTLEQVRGWGWLDAIHPDDREATNTAWAQALATRGIYETEYRIRRSDGEYRYFVARGVPVLHADGSIREWVGICTDIDQRKRAEAALRATQQYTRSLIEASLDPLVAISNNGRVTDVNRAAEEATGIDRAELLGSEFCRYFTEPEKAHSAYQRAFAEGSLQGCPLVLCHRSGRVTDVLYNASVFRNQAGDVEGVLAAARDITERKRLEDSLRQRTVELENSVAELEAFSYSV
ncbi:MAG TPA: PAS domain S-box protein, partial [Terriglobales bacterium]|nr:PAS domain S-box protein [Terriglobales bacterium]